MAGEIHQSARILQKHIDAALSKPAPAQTPSLPLLNDSGDKPQSEVRKGKAAYAQRAQKMVRQKLGASLAPPAGDIWVRAPEITVEQANASVAQSKRRRGRPRKVTKVAKAVTPTVLKPEKRVLIGDEARLTYRRLVQANMCIELFKRVQGRTRGILAMQRTTPCSVSVSFGTECPRI